MGDYLDFPFHTQLLPSKKCLLIVGRIKRAPPTMSLEEQIGIAKIAITSSSILDVPVITNLSGQRVEKSSSFRTLVSDS